MNKYQVYVDFVKENKDWEDDSKILVENMVVKAKNADKANEIAHNMVKEMAPYKEYYIWEVIEDDKIV